MEPLKKGEGAIVNERKEPSVRDGEGTVREEEIQDSC